MISERDRDRRGESGDMKKVQVVWSCSPNQRMMQGRGQKEGKKKQNLLFC